MARSVTWWLGQVLLGHIDMHDAPQAIQSWARFPIYQGAVEIVCMNTQDERRAALAKVPEKIRPYLEAEAQRLWPLRSTLMPPQSK